MKVILLLYLFLKLFNTVLFNIFIYNNININNETVIIFTLKIVIFIINTSVKNYKYKIIILLTIVTVINSVLIILLKNYKCKTVKIIIIINIFLINNDIIVLFILNFNLKVTAFLLKKHKQCKLFVLNIKMSIKSSANIIIINLQLFILNIINIIVKLFIIIIYLNTVNITEIKINIIFNNHNLTIIPKHIIKLKNLLLNAFKVVINIT